MRRPALLALLVLVSACAATSVPWSNPAIPKDQWSRDYSHCRRSADRDVGWREDDGGGSNPFREYDRQQAKKRYDAGVASCMIERGYVPASRSKE